MSKTELKAGTLLSPLPAVMVTCGDMEKPNVLTIAWTGIINTNPPMTYISVRPERYSYNIIKDSGKFVINLTTSKLVEAADKCGVISGKSTDKFEKCGLKIEPSPKLNIPMLCDSPISIECAVKEIKPLGSHDMFIAEIISVNVEKQYIDSKGKINLQQAGLMTYSHGEYFSLGRKLGDFGFSVRKSSNKRK
jgi:flavin reductase (DIM6/NTAB) family NADH-FMN oxidoreductase RutF